MFAKLNKFRLCLKPKLYTIDWYPSNRSCLNKDSRKFKAQQMPPLMVRKAEWRK